MKAITYHEYGPPSVLRLEEIPKPVLKDNQVLIRIHATTVTAGDWRMRKAEPFAARFYNGLLKPHRVTILGFECAGEVEAAGKEVRQFHPGDQVFAFAGLGFGCYAEYVCLPVDAPPTQGMIAAKPSNLTYQEAAALPTGALTALAFLRQADLQRGQRILIYGASGSVGTYAVQIARHFGAEVTGVCSTANLDLVQSLGADHVISYQQQDFAAGDRLYDCVFDAVGKAAKSQCAKVLHRNGTYLSVMGSAKFSPDSLTEIAALVEARELRPVIDRVYPLEQICDAHAYVESWRKRGNVVVML